VSKTIPTVTHLKKLTPCQHKGASWNVALVMAVQCIGAEVTIPQRNEIVQQLLRGEAVWLGRHLVHGELTGDES
jgi:hypothetical protein